MAGPRSATRKLESGKNFARKGTWSMKNPLESLHMTIGMGVALTVVLHLVVVAIGASAGG